MTEKNEMSFKEWVEKEIKDTCDAIIQLVNLDLKTASVKDIPDKARNYVALCDCLENCITKDYLDLWQHIVAGYAKDKNITEEEALKKVPSVGEIVFKQVAPWIEGKDFKDAVNVFIQAAFFALMLVDLDEPEFAEKRKIAANRLSDATKVIKDALGMVCEQVVGHFSLCYNALKKPVLKH